jgi:tetratricopeptide (TPR) repeat protein
LWQGQAIKKTEKNGTFKPLLQVILHMSKKQQVRNPQPVQAPAAAPQVKTDLPKKEGTSFGLSLKMKLCLLLGLITFVIYFNTLQNGFVLDDSMVYSKNTIVNKGFGGIGELFQTPRLKGFGYLKNENYRPLSLVMFATEVGMFGLNPAVGHFFNILFFSICVILLFLFLDKLFEGSKTVVAFISALLFAVHPIHTEVVANIKSLDEIFCFLFAFLAMNLFADYMKSSKAWQLAAGLVALFLSYLSKETVVTFLGIIPLVFFLYLNDDRKKAIFMTAGSVVVTGIYLLIRHKILSDYGASTTAVEFIDNALVGAPDMASRIATALYTMGMYVKLLIIPHPLIDDYGFRSIPYKSFADIWVLLTILIYVAAGVVGLLRLVRNRKDPWAFGILFYLATIALFSNIFFLMGSAMGERFLFFASAGFCLLAALAIEKWLLKGSVDMAGFLKNKVAVGALTVVCVLFSYLTFARNAEWIDNSTLFTKDLEKSPDNGRLNYYVGNELVENVLPLEKDTLKRKEILQASVAHLRKAIEIFPKYTDAYTELGTAYLNMLRYDSAEISFKTAISQSPYQSIAANNLGTVYLRTDHIPEAIAAYKLAIQIKADFVQAYCNLGACFSRIKQFDSAIVYLNKCLAISPDYAEAYMQLGLSYYFVNKFAEAEPYFNKVLALNPSDVNAANNLGAVYLNTGKYPQAVEIFKQLVAANPGYVNGYSNLGHCYYQMKQYDATVQMITKSLQLDPGNVKDIPFLALSYKALGNMAEAAKYEAISKQYFPEFKL